MDKAKFVANKKRSEGKYRFDEEHPHDEEEIYYFVKVDTTLALLDIREDMMHLKAKADVEPGDTETLADLMNQMPVPGMSDDDTAKFTHTLAITPPDAGAAKFKGKGKGKGSAKDKDVEKDKAHSVGIIENRTIGFLNFSAQQRTGNSSSACSAILQPYEPNTCLARSPQALSMIAIYLCLLRHPPLPAQRKTK